MGEECPFDPSPAQPVPSTAVKNKTELIITVREQKQTRLELKRPRQHRPDPPVVLRVVFLLRHVVIFGLEGEKGVAGSCRALRGILQGLNFFVGFGQRGSEGVSLSVLFCLAVDNDHTRLFCFTDRQGFGAGTVVRR